MAGDQACQNFQKERCAMNNDTDIVTLRQPESVDDPLTEIVRDGARRRAGGRVAGRGRRLRRAACRRYPSGRPPAGCPARLWPERCIQAGIDALDVQRPKMRDRATDVPTERRVRFTSAILLKLVAALAQPRCASAGALPARHLDGGLSGGAGRDPGAGCAEPVAECVLAADRGMAAGI